MGKFRLTVAPVLLTILLTASFDFGDGMLFMIQIVVSSFYSSYKLDKRQPICFERDILYQLASQLIKN